MTKRLFARRRRSTPSKGNPDISPDSTYCFCITLLNQQWPTDTMRTLTLSLPLLNPFDSMCDSRQDEDGVNCVPTRPLNQKSKNARKREKQQAKKQAAQQRSKPAHDPRFMDTSNKIHTHTRRRLCSGRCAHCGYVAPHTAGSPNGGYGCLCALKSWWSTLPTTAAWTPGGIFDGPCVIEKKRLPMVSLLARPSVRAPVATREQCASWIPKMRGFK